MSKRFLSIFLIAVAVLAGGAIAAVLVLGDDDSSERAAATGGGGNVPDFTLAYPDGWQEVNVDGGPDDAPRATVRREDGKAIVTMTVHGPVKQSLTDLEHDVVEEIESIDGATQVTSKRVEVAAGPALHTTWKQKKSGRIQSNLVVPAGEHSFSLDAIVTGDKKVANEVGDIFSAFEAD